MFLPQSHQPVHFFGLLLIDRFLGVVAGFAIARVVLIDRRTIRRCVKTWQVDRCCCPPDTPLPALLAYGVSIAYHHDYQQMPYAYCRPDIGPTHCVFAWQGCLGDGV